MKRGSIVAAVFVAALLVTAAQADDNDEPTTVDSIVVRGILPGPAWWRVSDADSIVHILVIPEATPAHQAWDSSVLENRLRRARGLVMPADVDVGLTQIPGLVRIITGEVIDKRDLEATLPEPLRARFIAARNAAGMKREQFARLRPVYAADRLERQVRKSQGMVSGEIAADVTAAARRRGVRKTQPTVKLKPERVKLSPLDITAGLARERDCLQATLQTMKPLIEAERRAASEWAAGDVRGLLAIPRLRYRSACDNDIFSRVERTHRSELLRAQIEAVEEALKTPGETIAVIRPGLLLSDDGVIMTMKARGYDIRTPANITD